MATYKVVFIFKQGDRGWTETWYRTDESTASLDTQIRNIIPSRVACCATDCRLQYVRAGDVSLNRPSEVFFTGDATTTGLPGDQTTTSVLCRIKAGALYRRMFLMRGLPDDAVGRDATGDTVITAGTNGRIQNFLNILAARGWQLKIRPKTGAGSTFYPMTAAPVAVPGEVLLTEVQFGTNPTAVVQGARFQIKGCRKTARKLNGVWTVQADETVDGDFQIPLPFVPNLSFVQATDYAKAVGRVLAETYANIEVGTPLAVRSRKTGRPLGVPAGKSKK